jgi:hypothetical protein
MGLTLLRCFGDPAKPSRASPALPLASKVQERGGQDVRGTLISSRPALADLHPMKLDSHRVVGTEVRLSLVPSTRSLVGPGVPGAPHPVATGRHWPRSTFPRVPSGADPSPTTHQLQEESLIDI